jgi:hypothetical protein
MRPRIHCLYELGLYFWQRSSLISAVVRGRVVVTWVSVWHVFFVLRLRGCLTCYRSTPHISRRIGSNLYFLIVPVSYSVHNFEPRVVKYVIASYMTTIAVQLSVWVSTMLPTLPPAARILICLRRSFSWIWNWVFRGVRTQRLHQLLHTELILGKDKVL